MEQLASGADLLVISCSVLDPPDSPPGLYERHSPPAAIGRMAARARVKALLCTHLPPAVRAKSDALRRSLATGFQGPVTLATDGLVVPVGAAAAPVDSCQSDADCSPAQSCLWSRSRRVCVADCRKTGCGGGGRCVEAQECRVGPCPWVCER